MSTEDYRKENYNLMSDSNVEFSDNGGLYRDYDKMDDGGGLCKKIFRSKSARLLAMLFFIIGYFLTELIVGHITHSLTLVADSFHMLSDALSLIVGFVAVRMSRRTAKDPFRPWPSKQPYFNTFGWVRFEVLGALINSTFLLALCISIFLEAIEKFIDPRRVKNPKFVLIVGAGGLIINILGLIMFGSHSHGHDHGHKHGQSTDSSHSEEDAANENTVSHNHRKSSKDKVKISHSHEDQQLNMKAVFLHVLGDALGSVIVMVSAGVLWVTGSGDMSEIIKEANSTTEVIDNANSWTLYLDPSMSLVLVCIMVCTTVPLFKQSSMILLLTVPKHIKLDYIRTKIRGIQGIQEIHDLHIWQLSGPKIVATVHVQCENVEVYLVLREKIRDILHEEGIHSMTVQPEFSSSEENILPYCQMTCTNDSCINKTCCPQDNPKTDPKKSPTNVPVIVTEQSSSHVTSTLLMAPSQDPPAKMLPNAIPSTTTMLLETARPRPRPLSAENFDRIDHAASTWSMPDATRLQQGNTLDVSVMIAEGTLSSRST